eukprot:scaffold52776_cov71-Cyclotella_meneghiniana.AAC.3
MGFSPISGGLQLILPSVGKLDHYKEINVHLIDKHQRTAASHYGQCNQLQVQLCQVGSAQLKPVRSNDPNIDTVTDGPSKLMLSITLQWQLQTTSCAVARGP